MIAAFDDGLDDWIIRAHLVACWSRRGPWPLEISRKLNSIAPALGSSWPLLLQVAGQVDREILVRVQPAVVRCAAADCQGLKR